MRGEKPIIMGENSKEPSCNHQTDNACLAPFSYLNRIPGKDVRGALIEAFQEWLRIPDEKLLIIKDIVGSLHNASLLIDDIEDNSKLRRGFPVAHSIFGIANTINCANYVFFLALEKCHSLGSDRATSVFVRELLNLHRGQGQDILWRDECNCPTEKQYNQMVLDKTGGLFRLAVGLMQSFSNSVADFTPLLDLLAMYFQIRDDLLNICSEPFMKMKSYCEDLTEGKFSYPIVHSIRSSQEEDSRLLSILRQRTQDAAVKRYAVHIMRETRSLQYTRDRLAGLRVALDDEIRRLGGHHTLARLIDKLHQQLLEEDTDSNREERGESGGFAANVDTISFDATSAASTPSKRKEIS